jgi:hypothetical protein
VTTQQLAYKSLPTIDGIEGAILPDPGKVGVWAWSASQAKPVYWDGTKWTSGSGSNGIEFDTSVNPSLYPQKVVIRGDGVIADTFFDNTLLVLTFSGRPTDALISFSVQPSATGQPTPFGIYTRTLFLPGIRQSDFFTAHLIPSVDHDLDDLTDYTVSAQCVASETLEICLSTKGAIVGDFRMLLMTFRTLIGVQA